MKGKDIDTNAACAWTMEQSIHNRQYDDVSEHAYTLPTSKTKSNPSRKSNTASTVGDGCVKNLWEFFFLKPEEKLLFAQPVTLSL